MKKFLCLLTAALCVTAFSACAAGSSADSSYESNSGAYSESGGVGYDAQSTENSSAGAEYGLKIVYTADISVETYEFDDSLAAIKKAVAEAGGYVSDTNVNNYSGNRYAYVTARIPAQEYESFLARGSEFGTVVAQSSSSQDITSSYIDTEARLSALEAQREQLLKLLDSATSVEDVISIQDRLSDVIYQIEDLTRTLKTYDDMVSFCTVNINLNDISNAGALEKTFGSQVAAAVKGSARGIVTFLRGFVIVIIYVLPYAIIAALIAVAVIAVIRRRRAKKMAAPKREIPQQTSDK